MQRVLMAILLVVIFYGCSGNGGGSIETTSTPWIHASDFDQNSNLHAKAVQTVLLPIDDSLNKTKTSKTVHTIRYYVSEDNVYNFVLDTNEPCIKEITAVDSSGQQVMKVNLSSPTSKVRLKQGSYTFTITEVTPMPEHCSISFMHHNQTQSVSSKDDHKALNKSGSPPEFMTGLFDPSILRIFGQLSTDGTQYQLTIPDNFNLNTTHDNYWYSINYKVSGNNPNPLGALIQATVANICKQPWCPSPWDNYISMSLYYDATQDNGSGSWMLQGYGFMGLANFGCFLTRDLINPPETDHCTMWGDVYDKAYLCSIDSVTQPVSPVLNKQVILTFLSSNALSSSQGCYFYNSQSSAPYRFTLDYWDPNVKNPRDLAFGIYNSLCPLSQSSCNLTFSSSMNTSYSKYAITPYTTSLLGAISYATPVTAGYDKIRLTELVRYYSDSSKLKDRNGNWLLNDGEVAIFENLQYTGNAIVLNADTNYALLPIKLNSFPIIGSVLLGKNTETITFADGTTLGQSNPNTTNMNLSVIGPDANNKVKVFKAINVIFTNDCLSCNLAGVQISNVNFKGRNFSGSYFSKANITNSVFDNANLSMTDFTNATMINNSFKSADFRNAVMRGANFSNSNFQSANLCWAKLNMFGNVATTFDGSYMRNVNLAFADLSGASMVNVSFNSMPAPAQGNACIPDSNCGFTNCATAYKATMNGTTLTGSYLAGLSMSLTNLTKSDFTNVNAIGVNFNNTVFSNDPSGMRTYFNGAILYGADFTNAVVQGVNFLNSYFDTPGQTLTGRIAISYLTSDYTNFKGSSFVNKSVCPQFSIATASVVPTTTDSSVICPSGRTGPCGISDWTAFLPLDPSLIVINKTTPYSMPSG
ncbi:MAG: pentapeptide repeat-containing protein, partial [Thermodesulfovibrionales bacterium]|nr:pentapeptide repeat-containing protein [Thermodesulfovibrionales bacterium]